jgi:hypothetical protein
MRLIDGFNGWETFEEFPEYLDWLNRILVPQQFAEAVVIDVYHSEIYFRCPNTDAGVFMPRSWMNQPRGALWLVASLWDTVAKAT